MTAETLTVKQVASALGRDRQTIRYLIDNRMVEWGQSYKLRGSKRKSYIIFKKKFEEATGIKLEANDDDLAGLGHASN